MSSTGRPTSARPTSTYTPHQGTAATQAQPQRGDVRRGHLSYPLTRGVFVNLFNFRILQHDRRFGPHFESTYFQLIQTRVCLVYRGVISTFASNFIRVYFVLHNRKYYFFYFTTCFLRPYFSYHLIMCC